MAAAPEELLERVDRIAPVIEEHAEQAEANRALSDAVYDALLDAGLFGMLVPKAFGGLELHPVQAYRVWEAVSRIDSAAGWNLQIGSSIGGFACWLPEDGAAELYARGPATVFAGGFFPAGPSLRVDGGWLAR